MSDDARAVRYTPELQEALLGEEEDTDVDNGSTRAVKFNFKTEAHLFFDIAWPSVVIQLMTFLLWMQNAIFVGSRMG
jgi:hypothetical protein